MGYDRVRGFFDTAFDALTLRQTSMHKVELLQEWENLEEELELKMMLYER